MGVREQKEILDFFFGGGGEDGENSFLLFFPSKKKKRKRCPFFSLLSLLTCKRINLNNTSCVIVFFLFLDFGEEGRGERDDDDPLHNSHSRPFPE